MRTIILGTLFALFLAGCEGFLEEKSQSEIRPSTVTDMEKLLEGGAYFPEVEGRLFNFGTDIFTDNLTCDDYTNQIEKRKKESLRWRFIWDLTMFDANGGGEDVTLWTIPYARIKGCNIVLDYAEQMSGDPVKLAYLRGEAYALRGFYYLILVNFFGQPYNEGDPSVNPGVPLKLISGVSEEKFTRNSVQEVYVQIEKDLLAGARLMEENDMKHTNVIRLKPLAAYALLSRMYLYKQDWDNVVKYANIVLEKSPDLHDLTTEGSVYYDLSEEVLWAGLYKKDDGYDYASHVMAFTVSRELVDLYGMDVDNKIKDIRGDYTSQHKNSYLKRGKNSSKEWVSHVDKSTSCYNSGGIRTAEVYLNRAEAYIQKYQQSGDQEQGKLGLADLNELRRNRFYAGYVDKKIEDFENADALLAFCLRERRRELCGEGNHRWFDLRRTGMPKMEHTFFYVVGEEQRFELMEKDRRYVLPIPARVLQQNTNLKQNEY